MRGFSLDKNSFDFYCQRSYKTKAPLTEIYSLSRTNNTNTIRGATLIHRNDPMHFAGYQHIPGICTLAYSVAEYFEKISFDCALSGPFDNLFLT